MDLAEKVKAIRAREGLTQGEFCSALGVSISTWKKYEAGIIEMGLPPIMKITNHPQFTRYTLWLMTGRAAPECGQVSPL